MGATATSQEARAAGFWKKDVNGRLNTQLFTGLNCFLDNCLREAAALSCGAGKKKKKKITQELFLHVTSGAVMTPVGLDDLAPVAVADCCKVVTQRGQGTTPSTANVGHTRETHTPDKPPAPVRVYRGRVLAALHRISCCDSGLSSFS